MAEIVGSAVVQETVSQVLSSILQKYEEKEQSNARKNLESLEMAHIRLEAALETSEKWHITDASLLRWRKKLKCAAKECDDTLHKYKHRILEEQIEREVRNSTFLKRIARATKSFVVSSFGNNDNQLSRSTVRRFEWFADGASEFIRFVELGCTTPRPHITINSFIYHLFSGKTLAHKSAQGHENPLFLLLLSPYTLTEHGIEARLLFIHRDGNAPKNNFSLIVLLQISESTDIVRIIIKCLQLFTPNFKPIVEIIKKELTQLTIQDLPWVPCVDYLRKHWDNLHCFSTQWFRPNPLCCKQHNQHKLCHSSKLYTSGSLDVSLEPVTYLFLQSHVLLSECNKRWPSLSEHQSSLKDSPYLEVGVAFAPHSSIEDMLPAGTWSALAAVEGERQLVLHTDISLEQLEEIMLPKAIDYFRKNAKATVHQMFWKSEHGTAYIQVEKASICTLRTSMRTSVTVGGARKRKMLQREDEDVGSQPNVLSQFLKLWVAHAPVQLRGSIVNWIQKEKESQIVAQHLHLKF